MALRPILSSLSFVLLPLLSLVLATSESRAASVEEAVERVRQQGTGPTLINDSLLRGLGANPANLEVGRTLFNASCALCHLENMRGKAGNAAVIGSDLTDNIWDRGGRPADIFTTIMNGALDTGMPPWKDVLGEEKVALVVAYILSRLPVVETPISAANAAHNAQMKVWLGRHDDIPRPAPGEPPQVCLSACAAAGGRSARSPRVDLCRWERPVVRSGNVRAAQPVVRRDDRAGAGGDPGLSPRGAADDVVCRRGQRHHDFRHSG
jgi:mono/diheme cytochrome c family protein